MFLGNKMEMFLKCEHFFSLSIPQRAGGRKEISFYSVEQIEPAKYYHLFQH